jgi:hypothetical protein
VALDERGYVRTGPEAAVAPDAPSRETGRQPYLVEIGASA